MTRTTLLALLPLTFSLAFAQQDTVPSLDAFTVRITTELHQRNPEAATLFTKANSAREQGKLEDAEALYRQVIELEPGFYHAKRRLADVVRAAGRREEALALIREAIKGEETPENLYGLLIILLNPGGDSPPAETEVKEAGDVARRLIGEPTVEPGYLPPICQAALLNNDLETLSGCASRLEQVSAEEPVTHYFLWLVALTEERFEDAEAALERARALGFPEDDYNRLKQVTEQAKPVWPQLVSMGWSICLAWLAVLAGLLAAGSFLSQVALRAARQVPAQRTGEALGLSGAVRSVYRVVLWLSCVYYFISIPLIVLATLAVGGAVVYGFAELGRIPIKLVLLIGVLVLATAWAGLNGLVAIFRKRHMEDPGEKLNLGNHEKLQQVLREVASAIGTRQVDSVYLTPGTEVAVMERGGLLATLRGSTERCLILGAGVLEGFRLGAFKAVLGHEYGHFSNRDTAGGAFALTARRSLDTMAVSLAAGGAATWYSPAWLFLLAFNRVFLRISQGASRLQEVMADRWAAFAYGSEQFERGLRHVIEATIRFEGHANATLTEVVNRGTGLSNLYHYEPAESPDEESVLVKTQEALRAQPSPDDSHPSPSERITLVQAVGAEGSGVVEEKMQDAWTLFDDRAEIESRMTAVVRRAVERNSGVVIPPGAPSETAGEDRATVRGEGSLSESKIEELRKSYSLLATERLEMLLEESGLVREARNLLIEELARRNSK